MKNTSKTLLFFGNERLSTGYEPSGAPTLQALIDAGYSIKAIIAHHGQTHSRTQRDLEIEAVARRYDIPVLLPQKPADISDQLIAFQAEAAVLIAYGKIIPQSVIDLFPQGIINIHPSLLPLYRGPTPIEQAILDGAQKTGVSIMKLTAGMDSGPVYAQQELALTGTESKYDLTTKLLGIGAELLVNTLAPILDGTLEPTAQDETKTTYTKLLTKADGLLEVTKTAETLAREIRAFALWPKSKISLYGKDVTVTKAQIVDSDSKEDVVLQCADTTYLNITELIAPSGKKMSGANFIRGYKT